MPLGDQEAAQKAAQQNAARPRMGPHGENGDMSFAYTSDADANTCDAMRSTASARKSGAGGIRTPVSNDATSVVGASCDDAGSEVAHKAAHLAAETQFNVMADAWASLPPAVRDIIVALVEQHVHPRS